MGLLSWNDGDGRGDQVMFHGGRGEGWKVGGCEGREVGLRCWGFGLRVLRPDVVEWRLKLRFALVLREVL